VKIIERTAYCLGKAFLIIVAVCVVSYVDVLLSAYIVALFAFGEFGRSFRAMAWICGLFVLLELSVAVWFIQRRRS
jgi:hypothetical protein